MKAILKYDYNYKNELNQFSNTIEFYKGVKYDVIHEQKHDNWFNGEMIVIMNKIGQTMSVSSHPDYVTLIEDDQELIDKLRYEGIGE